MFNKFFLIRTAIFVFFLCIINVNTFAENINSDIEFIYGKHKGFDRFVLEYNEKPEYKIVSDNYLSYIKLPKNINIINDISLDKYPRKYLLSTTTSEEEALITIPSPIIKSFEYENNKIVIDVVSYKDIKEEEQAENSKPKNNSVLHFPWDKEVGLAAFERNGNLWLVFDTHSEPDLSYIDTQQSEFVSNILQIPSSNITALVITTKGNFNIDISKENFDWNIALTEKNNNKSTEKLEALIEKNVNEVYLYVPTKNVKNVITMLDPYTGEVLMIAPVLEPNVAFDNHYKYVDLKFLKTYQGMVLEAFTDDIIIKKGTEGLTIEAANRGLSISPNLEKLKKEAK